MKKMIFGLAALASLATLATTVESSNTFGVLKLESPDKETIISVPWLKVGASSEATGIPANELVLTSNLMAGDKLFAYDTDAGAYYTWTLDSDKNWATTATTITPNTATTKSPANVTLLRGVGLILDRCGTGWTPDTETDLRASTPIYLYGQYAALTAGSAKSTVARSSKNMVTTIIAPPTTAAVDLNSVTVENGMEGDMIEVQLGTTYKFLTRNNKLTWCVKKVEGEGTTSRTYWDVDPNDPPTIPAGRGALYHANKGKTDQTVTITWNPSQS